MRTAGDEINHSTLRTEVQNRFTQLRRIDRPVMLEWDPNESHQDITLDKMDYYKVEQNMKSGKKRLFCYKTSMKSTLIMSLAMRVVIYQTHFIGWKFAISKDSFDNGVHFWHLKYETSSFREVPSIAFGLCVLPLQQGTTSSCLND